MHPLSPEYSVELLDKPLAAGGHVHADGRTEELARELGEKLIDGMHL